MNAKRTAIVVIPMRSAMTPLGASLALATLAMQEMDEIAQVKFKLSLLQHDNSYYVVISSYK